jgi:hypothetical protein
MRYRRSGRANPSRVPWAAIARLGYAHWILGNLYEAVVDMPQLLADAQPSREPRLLGAGSPVRYYLPATPLTLVATAATLIDSWRSGGDRRAIATAAAGTASAAALTGYLVRAVNLRLLQSASPLDQAERSRLVRAWHRGNLARLSFLAVAVLALRQAGQAVDSEMTTDPLDSIT